jgi:hypothetical protein
LTWGFSAISGLILADRSQFRAIGVTRRIHPFARLPWTFVRNTVAR